MSPNDGNNNGEKFALSFVNTKDKAPRMACARSGHVIDAFFSAQDLSLEHLSSREEKVRSLPAGSGETKRSWDKKRVRCGVSTPKRLRRARVRAVQLWPLVPCRSLSAAPSAAQVTAQRLCCPPSPWPEGLQGAPSRRLARSRAHRQAETLARLRARPQAQAGRACSAAAPPRQGRSRGRRPAGPSPHPVGYIAPTTCRLHRAQRPGRPLSERAWRFLGLAC
eukprot:351182-Chlamydomonas_euryale.AAC.5